MTGIVFGIHFIVIESISSKIQGSVFEKAFEHHDFTGCAFKYLKNPWARIAYMPREFANEKQIER